MKNGEEEPENKNKNGWKKNQSIETKKRGRAGEEKERRECEMEMQQDRAEELLLELRGVTKLLDGRRVLQPSDVKIKSGRLIGVAGDNGTGKTVLLKIMAGLMEQDGGAVVRKTGQICYMLTAENFYPWMRVRDAVRFYQDFFGDFDAFQARRLLAESELEENRRIDRLSRGEEERVCLLLALARRCRLYLMDEPLNGLDPHFKRDIRKLLLENIPEDASVVMATHLLRELEPLFDEMIFVTGDGAVQLETEWIREKFGKSVEEYYLEVVRCGKKVLG